MDFYVTIPATGDYSPVITTVTYVRDLTAILLTMAVQLVNEHSRLEVKDLELSLMITNDDLTVVLVELHASNVAFNYVFKDPYRFSLLGIPNFN